MAAPTIVIVPGHWLPSEAWITFRQTLAKADYPTEYVSLPSTRSKHKSLADDVLAAANVLGRLVDDGKDVIVLCHSSGGVVASNAVRGFEKAERAEYGMDGGVALVVYVSAFMVPAGNSLVDILGRNSPWMDIQTNRAKNASLLFPQTVLGDLSPSEAAKWTQKRTRAPTSVFATPSGNEPWAGSVACAYIFCEDDEAIPLDLQHQMAAQLWPEPNTASIQSAHCPFLSAPGELFAALEEVTSRVIELA